VRQYNTARLRFARDPIIDAVLVYAGAEVSRAEPAWKAAIVAAHDLAVDQRGSHLEVGHRLDERAGTGPTSDCRAG